MRDRFFSMNYFENKKLQPPKTVSSQPLSLPELKQKLQGIRISKPDFQTRLEDSGDIEYPQMFDDIINFNLINTPVMLNKNEKFTLDKDSALALPTATNPFFQAPILNVARNYTMTEQIEKYVSLIEDIAKFRKNMFEALERERNSILITDLLIFVKTKIQCRQNSIQARIELRNVLQQFIQYVSDLINKTDLKANEKTEEIKRLTELKAIEAEELSKEIATLKSNHPLIPIFLAEYKQLRQAEEIIEKAEKMLHKRQLTLTGDPEGIEHQALTAAKVLQEYSKLLLLKQDLEMPLKKFIRAISDQINNGPQDDFKDEITYFLGYNEEKLEVIEKNKAQDAMYYFILKKLLERLNDISVLEKEINTQIIDLKKLTHTLLKEGYPKKQILILQRENRGEIQTKKYHLYLVMEQFINEYSKYLHPEKLADDEKRHHKEITYIILNMQRKESMIRKELSQLFHSNNLVSTNDIIEKIKGMLHTRETQNGLKTLLNVPMSRNAISGMMLFPRHSNILPNLNNNNHNQSFRAPRPGSMNSID